MREILYARGIEVGEGEAEIEASQERDERFLDRVMSDLKFGQSFYFERNQEFARQEKWYYRDHYDRSVPKSADVPISEQIDNTTNIENEHLVTLNIPFSSVQRAHTMMTGEDPIIEVLSGSSRADKVVKMLHSVYQLNSRRWGSNPVHDSIFNQLLYGWGVLRTTWSRNDYDDEDTDFQGDRPMYHFPIEIKSLDPYEVYPIAGGTHEQWKAVVHRTFMKVYEVEEQWGVTLNHNDEDRVDEDLDYTEPLRPEKEVEVVDYWAWEGDQIIHTVVAHQQFVMRPSVMKFYDCLPFTIFHCAKTTSKVGGNMGLSVNYALVDSVSEMEWLLNRHMRIADLYADPTMVIRRVNDEPVDIEPGSGTIEILEGEDVYYLQFRGTLPDLDQLTQFFRVQVDEEGFSLPQAGQSGIDTIAQQQASLIKIFKPVENAQMALEDVNAKIVGLSQRYSWDDTIEVMGRMDSEDNVESFAFNIKGKDTKGMRNTKVNLRARFPLEELRNVAAAATLKNAELMPPKVVMKRLLHAQDPEAWRDEIMSTRAEDNPMVMQQLIDTQLQTIAQRSSIQKMVEEELNALAQQGMAPQQMEGMPPEDMAMRGQPSQQGSPEAPAPMQPPPEQAQMEGLLAQMGADQGMADNATPVPMEENPLANIQQPPGV
tara:strand:- start:14757 stop:16718 length:1962 start_codon:yes stop_codon:yes gene_type:complete